MIFSELRKRAKKAGQPPGTPIYTGKKNNIAPRVTVIQYSVDDYHESTGTMIENPAQKETGITWINVEGLQDIGLIEQIAKEYHLHPLTVEDILNVEQRPKVEEFEGYIFITLKLLVWNPEKYSFYMEQLSLVLGERVVLSFQENALDIFNNIRKRLNGESGQRLREQGSDYLAYRLIDAAVDQYFVVLEGLGDKIERIEERIIAAPTPQNSRTLYRLKRQLLGLRKAIWPVREAISHLMQAEGKLVLPSTRVYLRDVYDHAIQAIDTLEIFRDMLSGMLDMYLSSLTNRMNEIMKVLTIIATIFIPITFIASVFGMNFTYMPELHWHWGYHVALGSMFLTVLAMLFYFRRKKWL